MLIFVKYSIIIIEPTNVIFKNKKKMMQKKQGEDEGTINDKDVATDIVEPIKPEITTVKHQEIENVAPVQLPTVISEPEIKPEKEKPKTKVRRSIKPEINLNNIISSDTRDGYSLRTRRSNLISFDSPVKSNTPKRAVAKGIFTLPNCNSTIVEGLFLI